MYIQWPVVDIANMADDARPDEELEYSDDVVVDLLAILQKWVPYSQWYLFNAIPDTNHNANPTNPNRYSKGNPTLPVRCWLQYH